MSAMLIPEGWKLYSVNQIVTYVNGKAHEAAINEHGEYVVVNSRFISTDGTIKKHSNDCYCPASAGDVLMVMSDVPNGRAIAKCFYVSTDDTYTVNQRICILTPKGVDGKLLFYKLNRNQYYLAFDDGVKQTNLRKEDVLSCMITLPASRAEQCAIALALTDIDAIVGSLNQLITKKRDIQQAAMQQLLTGQRRLPGFSGTWEVKPMRSLGNTYGGLTGKTKFDFGHGEARYIPFMNVITGTVIDSSWLESVDVAPDEAQNLARKGDLFFNGSSETPEEVGFCSVLLEDIPNLYLNSFCFGFRFNTSAEVNGLFFAYWFRSKAGRAVMSVLAQGATRYNIAKSAFIKLEIPQPSEKEQTAIATVLSDMGAELAALEARRDKFRQIKQGMMQELLAGRIRLS